MKRELDFEAIGKRLKFEREKLGITQEEMAYRLGISDRQYRRYENGKSQLKTSSLFALQDMGIGMDYLCTGQIELDWWIERCFKIMPDGMLKETVEKMADISERHEEDGDDNELIDLFLKMRKYAKEHTNDMVLRDAPQFLYFTEGYEKIGTEKINSNKD